VETKSDNISLQNLLKKRVYNDSRTLIDGLYGFESYKEYNDRQCARNGEEYSAEEEHEREQYKF